MDITTSGETVNEATLTGAPAVSIQAADVRFVNRGTVRSTDSTVAAIQIFGSGAVIVNEADGIVGGASTNPAATDLAILGSHGDDTVINVGVINNLVDLGLGDDHLVIQARPGSRVDRVDMGEGDDTVDHEDGVVASFVDGGDGYDRAVFHGYAHSARTLLHFEELVFADDAESVDVWGYDGLDAVTFGVGDGHVRIDASRNPTIDLAIHGQHLWLGIGSEFRSITGSDFGEEVELSGGVKIGADVDLGEGDDAFTLRWSGAAYGAMPAVAGTVDAGGGHDELTLRFSEGGDFDGSAYVGFEQLTLLGETRLTGLGNFETLYVWGGIVAVADASAADKGVRFGSGSLTIEAGASVASIYQGPFHTDTGIPVPGAGLALANSGIIAGNVQLSNAADTYDGRTGMVGGTVFGFAGNDTFDGGSGNERFDGGSGRDTMRGGAGDDVYFVDNNNDVVEENADEGTDTVVTSLGTYTLGANVENLTASYTPGTVLRGNALDNLVNAASGVDMILLQDAGDDRVAAGAGADTIYFAGAFSAADSVDGGADTDTVVLQGDYSMTLGAASLIGVEWLQLLSADDTSYGPHLADAFRYLIVSRNENVAAGATLVVDGSGLAADENLTFDGAAETNGAFDLRGGAARDRLTGGAGADEIDGGAGADILSGRGGNDIYHVDASGDLVREMAGQGYDVVYTDVSYSLTEGMEVERLSAASEAGIEALTLVGNDAANVVSGNAGANALYGGGGRDALLGLAGNDLLDGGTGEDSLEGGLGDDRFYVDSAVDRIWELAGQGRDSVYSSISYGLAAGAEVELLGTRNAAGLEALALSGNEFANSVIANAGDNALYGNGGADYLVGLGGNDLLDGGTGADILDGGVGDDRYYVDSTTDIVRELAGQGRDAVYASVSFALREGAEVELLGTRNASGTEALALTGNGFDNHVAGNAGNNALYGKGGADYLVGLGGNDLLDGGADADILDGGAGNDRYYVDSAADLVREAAGQGSDNVYASVSYALRAGAEIELLGTSNAAGTAALSLSGNEFGNSVVGNAGSNTLSGGGGSDALTGLVGNDVLDGGTGKDFLSGGAGADTYRFSTAADSTHAAADTILDFTTGSDRIDLSAIDANTGVAGNSAFAWIGANAFTGVAGQLRVQAVGSQTWVYGDVDGDAVADLVIAVNATAVAMGDFVL